MMELSLIDNIKTFVESETRSCSMDFGCITPLYVFRMFGGQNALTDIENALGEVKKQGAFGL